MTDMTTDLSSLVDETVALFHQLTHAAARIHRQGAHSAARRGVLRSLAAGGPQTVPSLARARPVSRQHIQMLVNALKHDRLVEVVPNPSHRRSSLIRLTRRGRTSIDAMARREQRVFGRIGLGVSDRRLRAAAGVLRHVRRSLERGAWAETARNGARR